MEGRVVDDDALLKLKVYPAWTTHQLAHARICPHEFVSARTLRKAGGVNFGTEFLSNEVVEASGGGQLNRERLVPFHNGEEQRDNVEARQRESLRQVEQVIKRLLHIIRPRHVIRQGEQNLRSGFEGRGRRG